MWFLQPQSHNAKKRESFPGIYSVLGLCSLSMSLGLFTPKPIFASEAIGRIEKIEEISDGRFVVLIEGAANRPKKPSCLHPVGYFMVANENSEKGIKQIRMLRKAKKENLTVSIVGTGTCKRFVDAEDINYLSVQPTPKPIVGSEATGRIEKIEEISDGRFVVLIEGAANRPKKPSCLHPVGYFMVADENSTKGKKQIKMLKEAKENNLIVSIVGTGTCKRWVDAEDINYFSVQDKN